MKLTMRKGWLGAEIKRRTQTAFVVDSKGNRWMWNCGWYIVDKNGNPLKTRTRKHKVFLNYSTWIDQCHISVQRADIRQQPMSHAEFRRSVTILDPSDKKQREVLHGMDRPGRMWRRYVHREVMQHDQYGSVYLLATDGCHAVVETRDGDHKYVCFENLTENVAIPLPSRHSSSGGTKRAPGQKSDKSMALLNKYLINLDNA